MYSNVEIANKTDFDEAIIRGDIYGLEFSVIWENPENNTKSIIGVISHPPCIVERMERHAAYLTEYVKLAKMSFQSAKDYLKNYLCVEVKE